MGRFLRWLCLLHLVARTSNACSIGVHILHGVDLGRPVMHTTKKETWEHCCNFCATTPNCISWTFLIIERRCMLRDRVGPTKQFLFSTRERIVSSIMNSTHMPFPIRRNTTAWVHVVILSMPTHWKKVPLFYVRFRLHG